MSIMGRDYLAEPEPTRRNYLGHEVGSKPPVAPVEQFREAPPYHRYILFAWQEDSPYGGLGDLVTSANTVEDLEQYSLDHWWCGEYNEVVDRDTWEEVKSWSRTLAVWAKRLAERRGGQRPCPEGRGL